MKKFLAIISMFFTLFTYSVHKDYYKYINGEGPWTWEEVIRENTKDNYKEYGEYMDSLIGYWRNNSQIAIITKEDGIYYINFCKTTLDHETANIYKYDMDEDIHDFYKNVNKISRDVVVENVKLYQAEDVFSDEYKWQIFYVAKTKIPLMWNGKKFATKRDYIDLMGKEKNDIYSIMSSFWLTLDEKGLHYLPNVLKPVSKEEFVLKHTNYLKEVERIKKGEYQTWENREWDRFKKSYIEIKLRTKKNEKGEIEILPNVKIENGKKVPAFCGYIGLDIGVGEGEAKRRYYDLNPVLKDKVNEYLVSVIEKLQDEVMKKKKDIRKDIVYPESIKKDFVIAMAYSDALGRYEYIYKLHDKNKEIVYEGIENFYAPLRKFTEQDMKIWNEMKEYTEDDKFDFLTKEELLDTSKIKYRRRIITNRAFAHPLLNGHIKYQHMFEIIGEMYERWKLEEKAKENK